MQKYIKTYLNYFDFKVQSDVICEICDRQAVDIHHIKGRGKGMDVIENLIAVCRGCHNDCHNEKYTKAQIQSIHNCFLRPDTGDINEGLKF